MRTEEQQKTRKQRQWHHLQSPAAKSSTIFAGSKPLPTIFVLPSSPEAKLEKSAGKSVGRSTQYDP